MRSQRFLGTPTRVDGLEELGLADRCPAIEGWPDDHVAVFGTLRKMWERLEAPSILIGRTYGIPIWLDDLHALTYHSKRGGPPGNDIGILAANQAAELVSHRLIACLRDGSVTTEACEVLWRLRDGLALAELVAPAAMLERTKKRDPK